MASASCSCSSSSPLVWGRACSSSEDTRGEVAVGKAKHRFMLSRYPGKSQPIPPHTHKVWQYPSNVGIERFANTSRFKSSNVRCGFTTAMWRQLREDASGTRPALSPQGFTLQPALQSCPVSERNSFCKIESIAPEKLIKEHQPRAGHLWTRAPLRRPQHENLTL